VIYSGHYPFLCGRVEAALPGMSAHYLTRTIPIRWWAVPCTCRQGDIQLSSLLRVLIVANLEHVALEITRVLQSGGYDLACRTVSNAGSLRAALAGQVWDVVLWHDALSSLKYTDGLALMKKMGLDIPFIVMSDESNEQRAAQAMEAGAHDFLSLGGLCRLPPVMARELHAARERKKHLQALRNSRRRYRRLFDGIPVGLYRSTLEGHLLTGNRTLVDMLGYPDLKTLLADSSAELFVEESDRLRTLQQLESKDVAHDDAIRLRRRDGTIIWARADTHAVKDRHGRLLYHEGSLQDITEQQFAKGLRGTAAALASSLSFDEVLDTVLDQVGRVVPHDASTIMLIEDDVAPIVRSRGWVERGLEEYVASVRLPIHQVENLRTIVETGQPLAIPHVRNYPGWYDYEGGRWIESHAGAPIRCKGKITGFLNLESTTPGFFTQARAEQLQAFADQVGVAIEHVGLYTELQKTNARLQAALESKDEMLQNISHELRTPLTTIFGYIELLNDEMLGALTPEQKDALIVVKRQSDRLLFLVTRLLTFQTLDSHALEPVDVEVDVLMRRAVSDWEIRAGAAGLELSLDIDPNLPQVHVDPNLVGQVLENLLDNAIKFSTQGGRITLKACKD
jgi:PAS domain S-box-containing protein